MIRKIREISTKHMMFENSRKFLEVKFHKFLLSPLDFSARKIQLSCSNFLGTKQCPLTANIFMLKKFFKKSRKLVKVRRTKFRLNSLYVKYISYIFISRHNKVKWRATSPSSSGGSRQGRGYRAL